MQVYMYYKPYIAVFYTLYKCVYTRQDQRNTTLSLYVHAYGIYLYSHTHTYPVHTCTMQDMT